MAMKYKAVIFDLGGVILGSPLEGIAEYEKENGIPHNYININIAVTGHDGAFQKLERGEYGDDTETFYAQFEKELRDEKFVPVYKQYLLKKNKNNSDNSKSLVGEDDDSAIIRQIKQINARDLFFKMMTKSASIDEAFFHAVFVLRGSGIKTAALTNNFSPMGTDPNFLATSTSVLIYLKSIFDVIFESAVEGIRKPNPDAYLITMQRLQVNNPKEVIFLDDIGTNLKAAQDLGIKTIRVELSNKHKALVELENLIFATPTNNRFTTTNLDNSKCVTLFYNAGNGGGKIVGDFYGNAIKQPVILMHGGGQRRFAWTNTAKKLAMTGKYCCFNFDHKGHGDSYFDSSDRDAGTYLYPDFGSDLDSLMNAMGFSERKPILIGASLGGMALMSSTSALTAKACVLVDVTPRLEKHGVDRVLNFMTQGAKEGFHTLQEVAEKIKAYNPLRKKEPEKEKQEDLEGLKKNLRFDDVKKRWFWHWDPRFLKDQLPTVDQLDFMERALINCARNITAPTLLIRGMQTDIVSLDGVKSLKTAIPHSQVIDVKDAAHMVAGDNNDIFMEGLLRFLEALDMPDAKL